MSSIRLFLDEAVSKSKTGNVTVKICTVVAFIIDHFVFLPIVRLLCAFPIAVFVPPVELIKQQKHVAK